MLLYVFKRVVEGKKYLDVLLDFVGYKWIIYLRRFFDILVLNMFKRDKYSFRDLI